MPRPQVHPARQTHSRTTQSSTPLPPPPPPPTATVSQEEQQHHQQLQQQIHTGSSTVSRTGSSSSRTPRTHLPARHQHPHDRVYASPSATTIPTPTPAADHPSSSSSSQPPPQRTIVARSLSPASFRSSAASSSRSEPLPQSCKRKRLWGWSHHLGYGSNSNNNSNNNNSSTRITSSRAMRYLRRRIPMLSWLVSDPGYNWKGDLTQDLFAGATISAVIIPQSMAYAMLASLPPVHGLYTSLIPTVIYAVLGTSRHMSTGTFAITALLLGQFTHKILSDQGYIDDAIPDGDYHRRYLPLCLLLTFCVGAVQILLSMARLGRWTSKHLLPISLVSGFNTASAFHIGTHQLKHWFGMKPPRESGVFSMIKTWIWIIHHFWEDTIWASLAMGLAAMVFMYILQRIEYRRRSASESKMIIAPSFSSVLSPAPSPASVSFPFYQQSLSSSSANLGLSPPPPPPPLPPAAQAAHPLGSNNLGHKVARSASQRATGVYGNSKRRSVARHGGIVPRAVSDQALLTAQDVALVNSEQSFDSGSSPCWSPALGPTQDSDREQAMPNLNLPGSSSPSLQHHPSMRDTSRPVIITSATGTTQPQMQSPTSPRVAGLTNTGAFGHRQERTRPQKSSPSPRTYRHKSFRSPTSVRSNRQRAFIGSEDEEEEPLLAKARLATHQPGSRRGSAAAISPVHEEAEGYNSGSSASSMLYMGYNEYEPRQGEIESGSDNCQDMGRWSFITQWIPKVHFPIPDIFICVVVFTAATAIFDLDERYRIEVIGYIPTGLPSMTWPPAMIEPWSSHELIPLIWPSILMAIVVYVMSLSVAKHFGREYGYEVDADQEMLAIGVGSLVGSCFGGYACTGNLTRSAILAQLGAKTPLASLVGAFMVLMSLLWFTVLFERIPNTILAAIVLVALRSLMVHAFEAKRLWRVGRRKEALIWWVTFMSVIVFSIEIGLAVGMATVVVLKLYKNGKRWRRTLARSIKQSATYQRLMLMLGLQSPLFTTAGRGLYTGDDEDDY